MAEMRTELIIETANALNNIKILKDTLEAIDHIKFQQLSKAMDSIGQALNSVSQNADKFKDVMGKVENQVNDTADNQTKKIKTLKAELSKQISDMQKLYSQNPDVVNTPEWGNQKQKLVSLTQQVGKMEESINGSTKALKYLQDAFERALPLGKIDGVIQELSRLSAQAQNVKDMMNVIKSDANKYTASGQLKNQAERDKVLNEEMQIRTKLASLDDKQRKKYENDDLKRRVQNEYELAKEKRRNDAEYIRWWKQSLAEQDRIQARIAKATAPKTADQRLNAQINAMQIAMSKNPDVVNKSSWDTAKNKLVNLSIEAAKAKEEVGKTQQALKRLEDAFRAVGVSAAQNMDLDLALKAFYRDAKQAEEAIKRLKDEVARQTPKGQATQIYNRAIAANNEIKARQTQINKAIQADNAEVKVLNRKYKIEQALGTLTTKNRQTANRLLREYAKIQEDIRVHSGDTGLYYTAKQYDRIKNKIAKLREEMERLQGNLIRNKRGDYLNISDRFGKFINAENMLQDVKVRGGVQNTNVGTLKQDIDHLTEQAAKFYNQWVKTKDVVAYLSFKKTVQQLHEAQKEADKFNRRLQNITSLKDQLYKMFDFLERRAKWAMTGLLSNITWDIPNEIVSSYGELERAMAGVRQVMPLIEKSIPGISDATRETNAEFERLNNIAADFGRTTQEVIEAAQLWGRGYGKGEYAKWEDATVKYQKEMEAMATTNELARQSAILATVDNFGMAESVRGLEAVLAAYNMRAKSAAEATLFAGRAVDIITKVSHRGQISAQELVQGLQATGKAAEQAGVSLAFLTALIETGVRDTGMSGSNIGNALKSMMVGLQSDKAIEEMRKFGVEAYKVGEDGTRTLRPMEDVILEIATALRIGDQNAKNLLLRISGGKMQFSKVSAILKDGAEIMRMWGEASNSAGFAQEQLEVQLNTFVVKLQRIKDDLTQLTQDLASGGLGKALKFSLDKIDAVIKSLHSLNGISGINDTFNGFAIVGGLTVAIPMLMRAKSSLQLLIAAQKEYALATQHSTAANLGSSAIIGGLRTKLGLQTAAQASATAAIQAETASVQVNTAMKMQNVAATTAMTGGINLIMAALAAVVTGYGLYSMATDDATDAANGHKKAIRELNDVVDENHQLKIKDIDTIHETAQLWEQQIQQERDIAGWLEKGGKMYIQYKQAVDDANRSEEDRKKLREELELMENKFIAVLTKEQMEQLKTATTTAELEAAFKSFSEAHSEMATQKLKELETLKTAEINKYKQELETHKAQLQNYQKGLDGFKAWSDGQIKGLGLLKSAWASFYGFVQSVTSWIGESFGNLVDNSANYVAQLTVDTQNTGNPAAKAMLQNQLAEATSTLNLLKNIQGVANQMSLKSRSEIDKIVASTQGVFDNAISETQKIIGDTNAKITKAQSELKGIEDLQKLFEGDRNPGKESEKDAKSKKNGGRGRNKKQQIMYSTDVEKAIHNMMADGRFSDDGWTHSLLKALTDYSGGNVADLAKISSKIEEYFRPNANKNNPMEIAYAFQQYALNNSNNKGWEGVIENLYGAASDTVKAKLKNDAKWIEDNFNWKNSFKGIYGEESTSVEKAVKDTISQAINYGNQGCVRAALDIGRHYSEFLKSEFEAGEDNVRNLLQHAKEKGINVSDYDESKLKVGNLVTWQNNSNDPRDVHVGVVTGKKGGVWMAADNSSGRADRGQASLMERPIVGNRGNQRPDHIIHINVDADKIPWVNSKKKGSIFEWVGDVRNREDNKVKEQYAHQSKAYEIAVERAKLEQEFTGDTISYQKAINNLRELHIKQMSVYIDEMQEAYDKGVATLNNYIANSKTIQAALKRAKVASFYDLSETEQKDLLDTNAKSGGELAQRMAKAYETLKQIKDEIPKLKNERLKEENAFKADNGYMTPADKYNYQRQLVDSWNATSRDNRLLKADRQLELDLGELQRLENQYLKQKAEDENRINQMMSERLAIETQIAELNKKETLNDKDKDKLQNLNEQYQDLGKQIDNLKANGSPTFRTLTQEVNKQTTAVKNSALAVRDIIQEYRKAGADITVDFFDKLINESQSLGDTIEDLRKQIAQIAIKYFTYRAFNLPIDNTTFGNSPLEQILIHSQNKGEQDITPIGLNTTELQNNTVALNNLADQIAGEALNPNQAAGSMTSTNPINPALTQNPAVNQLATSLQTLSGNIPQITSQLSQFAIQQIQKLPLEQQELLLKQQGITVEQFNQMAMERLAASTDLNTTATNNLAATQQEAMVAQQTATKSMSAAGGFGGFNILGFLPMLFALLFGDKKGGSLEGFAKGGKPTNGLIKGAGTGTSDSILTYLEHKKRFIKTSDGEFILNAKATDKLGVGTLNAINKNPELFQEMLLEKKGLATGGSVEMVPTMKPSTAKTYKSYTQSKAELSNPNGRMEELMAEQNGLISGISQGNDGRIVVLNTQADSNAVMKAIHDNPKAFRNLLGQQKKRGFQ